MTEPSTPEDDKDPWIELPQPTQCVLWEKPELVNGPEGFDTIEELSNESHLARSVLQCRECGQLYFYEFYEIVDWEAGNDRLYWTFIPVDTPERIESLNKASVFGLMLYSPRLLRDHKGTRWIR